MYVDFQESKKVQNVNHSIVRITYYFFSAEFLTLRQWFIWSSKLSTMFVITETV